MAVLLCVGLHARAPAQEPVNAVLDAAQASFDQGRFDEAILQVSDVLRRPLDDVQAAAAYQLLILSNLRHGRTTEAKLGTVELLHRVPDHRPDPAQAPPHFVALVDSVRHVIFRPPAQDTVSCARESAEARDHYVVGDFDAVATALGDCINRHYGVLTDTQLRPMLRLLTLAHLNRGDLVGAKRSAMMLLSRTPGYRPDPVADPPSYNAFVELLTRHTEAVDDR